MFVKLLSALAIVTLAVPLANARPSIQNLKPNEKLVIQAESYGCFHRTKSQLLISPKLIEVDEKVSIPLTQDIAEGLDQYFIALDHGVEGGCTTQENFTISLLQNDTTVKTWSYVDGSCRSVLPTFKGILPTYGDALPAGTDWTRMKKISEVVWKAKKLLNEDKEKPSEEPGFETD